MFKVFKKEVENEIKLRAKCLRFDNGGELTSREFEKFYEKEGIKRKYSIAKTPKKNGVAKREN